MTDKKRITIYVSEYEYNLIKRFADRECTSMSKALCGAVRCLLEQNYHPGQEYDFRWGFWR